MRREQARRGIRVAALAIGAIALAGWAAAWAGPPAAMAGSLKSAEDAYASGDYGAAIAAYREVLESGWVSASLYYDLGSACYREGERGWAVFYLEEARRLAPRDPDIRHNLLLARQGAGEGTPALESSWLLDALAGALDSTTPRDCVRGVIALGWLCVLAVCGVWFLPAAVARWCRPVSRVAVLLLALGLGWLALKAYQVHSAPSGVVVAGEVDVRSGPLPGETVQFVLHAGASVKIGRSTGSWREVALSGDMRGWVPADAVAALRAPEWSP
jgi:hypothetical protein